jgi:hypothetical protein
MNLFPREGCGNGPKISMATRSAGAPTAYYVNLHWRLGPPGGSPLLCTSGALTTPPFYVSCAPKSTYPVLCQLFIPPVPQVSFPILQSYSAPRPLSSAFGALLGLLCPLSSRLSVCNIRCLSPLCNTSVSIVCPAKFIELNYFALYRIFLSSSSRPGVSSSVI